MVEPGTSIPPAPPRNEADDEIDAGGALSKHVFATYTARTSNPVLSKALPHPGDIAEAASLSAIPLPHTDFPLIDSIPEKIIADGKLSQLQLEGILHACSKHQTINPSGERCGFFIGDGAGVGKGRQIAGVILDSYVRGRKKHAWISTSTDLYNDAKRDFKDLGCHIPVLNNLQSLDTAKSTPKEGVMFVTYATLTSQVKGQPRLQQLIRWLGGAEFDGCLIFDEAHKAKRFSSKEGAGTKVATAVVELQKQLPLARVLYCSATGVSEVGNMAYMSRLNLWGPGSAFDSFDEFVNAMKKKGVSFLESLAMELKYDGLYVARGLSFRTAEFLELECPLSPQQIAVYDAASQVWALLRSHLARAAFHTGATKDVWKPFWGAQQRFFKLLCVSMKTPSIVKEAREALAAGQCVVIGLQSTGEAAMDALQRKPGDVTGFVSVCREILVQFVGTHFPVVREGPSQAALAAGNGTTTNNGGDENPMNTGHDNQHQQQQVVGDNNTNSTGGGWFVFEAVELRRELLDRINALDLPPNFLDEIIDALGGPVAVAEMTGRKSRVVRDGRGRLVYELRAKPESNEMDSLNIKEQNAFMDGKKLVAIVSDAASTGISLHASAVRNNQRRRVHLTVELPWAADKAIQQLGRSHRSNQVCAPLYKLAFTDVGGERRFAAAVARRLQSLGALTRGDRRAASGLDMASLNFDSPLGRTALRKMHDALVTSSPLLPDGVTLEGVLAAVPESEAEQWRPRKSPETGRSSAADLIDAHVKLHEELRRFADTMGVGLGLPKSDGAAEQTLPASSSASKDVSDVRRFLNRLLGAPINRQTLLFSYFQQVLEAEIVAARKSGYVEGVSDLVTDPGQRIRRQGPPQILWVDDSSGLQTMRHDLTVDRGVSYEQAKQRLEHERAYGDKSGFYRSRRIMPGTGRHAVILAIQKAGTSGVFVITRPNTGTSAFEMDDEELHSKYTAFRSTTNRLSSAASEGEEQQQEGNGNQQNQQKPDDAVAAMWNESYEAALHQCSHGVNCTQGPHCHVGKRLLPVTILSGSVVRIWDVLERVLARHELELNKSDRSMRIVRVEMNDHDDGGAVGNHHTNAAASGSNSNLKSSSSSLPIIGVRYPSHLLAEVVVTLRTMRESGAVSMVRSRVVEPPTPVDGRALKKALQPPQTILSMFAAKNQSVQGGLTDSSQGGKQGGAGISGRKRLSDEGVITNEDTDGGSNAAANITRVAEVKKAKITTAAAGVVPTQPKMNKRVPSIVKEAAGNSNMQDDDDDEVEVLIDSDDAGTTDEKQSDESKEEVLMAMGFSKSQAVKSLQVSGGNVERAANWLLGGH